MLKGKATEVQAQLGTVGQSLGSLGRNLVVGTSDLFDQIRDAVQNEMPFDEGRGRRGKGPGAFRFPRLFIFGSALTRIQRVHQAQKGAKYCQQRKPRTANTYLNLYCTCKLTRGFAQFSRGHIRYMWR